MLPGMTDGPRTLAVDLGGTGMKMLVLDAEGKPIDERTREPTPKPASPESVLGSLLTRAAAHEPFDRIAFGFPGVVRHGIVHTAPNLGTALWRGVPLELELQSRTGRPARVVNDADLQGYGVVAGQGVEMVLTLGTGLGAALFVDGHLVPNLELGHHPFTKGKTYEQRVCDAELRRIGKQRWTTRVQAMFEVLEPVFNYDRLHLGGGNVRHLRGALPAKVRVFANAEGLRGGLWVWRRAQEGARSAATPS